MGTAVIGGMLASSFLAIFVIPALFYMIERLGGAGEKHVKAPLATPTPEPGD
jgi:HAE1 family hydrophobic/amphiphilic exporter-1